MFEHHQQPTPRQRLRDLARHDQVSAALRDAYDFAEAAVCAQEIEDMQQVETLKDFTEHFMRIFEEEDRDRWGADWIPEDEL